MPKKDWSKFKLHCCSISKMVTHPSKFKKLTKPEEKRLAKYQDEGVLSTEEEDYAQILQKQANFLNPPELAEGAKTHLIERYSKDKYDTRRAAYSLGNPRQSKGSSLEVDGAQFLSELDGVNYQKPEENESNEWLVGKADLLTPNRGKVVEIKTVWSTDTYFPHYLTILPPSVWYQTQGYLELYNIDRAQVCYVLINTPQHLIDQEIATIHKKFMYGEMTREKYEYCMSKMELHYDYSKINAKRRVIRFDVQRHRPIIPFINYKISLSREWLSQFDKIHTLNKNIITLPEHYINAGSEEDNT